MRAAVGVVLAMLVAATFAAPAFAIQDFGARTAGQHVYDHTGTLTPPQVSDLEARATALDRAGTPAIVYLRLQASDQAATRRDAGELMDAWQVESSSGARDGLVAFVNLSPSDPKHGAAALFAGSAHVNDGSLSAARLQGIFDRSMRPLLAEGEVAGGLAAGLDAAGVDLANPAPSSSANVGLVLGIIGAMIGAGTLLVLGLRTALTRGSRAGWGISDGSGAGGYPGYTGTSWTDSGASGSSAGGSGSSGGGGGGDSGSGGSSGGGSF